MIIEMGLVLMEKNVCKSLATWICRTTNFEKGKKMGYMKYSRRNYR
jgi:hypothetical protein